MFRGKFIYSSLKWTHDQQIPYSMTKRFDSLVANETKLSAQLTEFSAKNEASLTVESLTGRLSIRTPGKWKVRLE